MVRNMKKFKTLALAAAVSAGLLASTGVMAAEDGGLETNGPSVGWFDIFLYNNAKAKIWGLEDFTFTGTTDPNTDSKNVCVWTNTSEYRMTVESDNGDFKLKDAADGVGADYTVTIKNTQGTEYTEIWGAGAGQNGDGFTPTTDFIVGTGNYAIEPTTDAACAGRQNVNVKIDLSNVNAAVTGAYSDRVTLTVAPI